MPGSDENFKVLGRLGGVTALLLLAYVLATMAILVGLGAPPASAEETLEMLRQNRLAGLLRLDMLTTLFMPLYYLLFFALYLALKKTHDLAAKAALLLGCAGVTLFLAAPAFVSWMALSDKFAAATSEAQKNLLLAAGESIFVTDLWHSSTAFVGGLLLQASLVLISLAMLRSRAFSKWTAWLGVVTHGLDLAHIPLMLFLPSVGAALLMVGGTLYLAWFPLLARDFFRLAKE
ncbi:MAG: hypothetical protein ACOYYS_03900 [Chloroflexota bacterium]